jgi:hypothetical protein
MEKLNETVNEELEITMNLACYISGLLDAFDTDTLTQAKDTLISNYKLITALHLELHKQARENNDR